MVAVKKYKKYPAMVKLAAVKKLRSKVDKQLDMDLPPSHELHRMLNPSTQRSKKADRKLREIHKALEHKASEEEMEEFEAELAVDEALADLEATMVKLERETRQADEARNTEEQWQINQGMTTIRWPTEDAKYFADKLRRLREDIAEGMSDEEQEMRVSSFVAEVKAAGQKKRQASGGPRLSG